MKKHTKLSLIEDLDEIIYKPKIKLTKEVLIKLVKIREEIKNTDEDDTDTFYKKLVAIVKILFKIKIGGG